MRFSLFPGELFHPKTTKFRSSEKPWSYPSTPYFKAPISSFARDLRTVLSIFRLEFSVIAATCS